MHLDPRTMIVPVFKVGVATLTVAALTMPAAAQQFQDQTAARFPAGPAEYTNYIAVGDIDVDGDLDLVFANGGNFSSAGPAQQLRVFINDGAGNFADESVARANGQTGNYRGVEMGDIDGDGDLDMILAQDFNRRPALLVNDGSGTFTNQTATRLPLITLSATRGQFGDIDNDGDLDLYINNGGASNRFGCGQNVILINDGAGVFSDETADRHPAGNVCQPMDVIFGDIDNDFDLDVRTGNRANNSKLYENDGTGVFTDISAGVPGDSNDYSYDFGDMDGDGNLDLLGANAGPSNREQLLKGDGAGGFTDVSSQIVPNTTGDDNDSKFFDLDDDGDLDMIVAALYQSREKIYLNDGSGNFALDATRITSISDASLDVAVADFDNDGDLDIVTGQGESGSFVNRIYINVTGPADSIPPNVVRTEQVDDTCDVSGPFVVRATVFDGVTSDRGFYDKGVVLNYAVDAGPPQAVPMRWSGNSLWRGEIPGAPAGGTVSYFVTAKDYNDNEGTGATLTFDVTVLAGDVDGDGEVGFTDLTGLLASWGPCGGRPCPADVDGDDEVGFTDLTLLLQNWGSTCSR